MNWHNYSAVMDTNIFMDNDNRNEERSQKEMEEPQNISGKNVAQTKERTEPLKGDETHLRDQQEGEMDNGELGAGLKETKNSQL